MAGEAGPSGGNEPLKEPKKFLFSPLSPLSRFFSPHAQQPFQPHAQHPLHVDARAANTNAALMAAFVHPPADSDAAETDPSEHTSPSAIADFKKFERAEAR